MIPQDKENYREKEFGLHTLSLDAIPVDIYRDNQIDRSGTKREIQAGNEFGIKGTSLITGAGV